MFHSNRLTFYFEIQEKSKRSVMMTGTALLTTVNVTGAYVDVGLGLSPHWMIQIVKVRLKKLSSEYPSMWGRVCQCGAWCEDV